MATIPIGLARLIEGIGLNAILLQDRSLSKEQLQRLAGAALLLGAALTVLYLALSAPISLYFQKPQVAAIVSVLNLTFVIDALQILRGCCCDDGAGPSCGLDLLGPGRQYTGQLWTRNSGAVYVPADHARLASKHS